QGPVERLGVRVQQQLRGIEAMAVLRLVRTVDAIAVALAGPQPQDRDVPDQVGLLRHRDPRDFVLALGAVQEAHLDAGGVFGKHGKVDRGGVPSSSEGIGHSRPDFHWRPWESPGLGPRTRVRIVGLVARHMPRAGAPWERVSPVARSSYKAAPAARRKTHWEI